MIRYIYAEDLKHHETLARTMFRDRAQQFRTRLKWDVSVDATGFEIDQYDEMNPLYVIWEMENGTHGGSMRLLPTTGDTMINDHFTHLTDGVKIVSPLIWECTRFCLSPRHEKEAASIAASLLVAGCEMGLQVGLTDSVGVFDARMVRIYKRIGWEPTIVGTDGASKDRISVGLWEVSEAAKARICAQAGLSLATPTAWYEASFHAQARELAA